VCRLVKIVIPYHAFYETACMPTQEVPLQQQSLLRGCPCNSKAYSGGALATAKPTQGVPLQQQSLLRGCPCNSKAYLGGAFATVKFTQDVPLQQQIATSQAD